MPTLAQAWGYAAARHRVLAHATTQHQSHAVVLQNGPLEEVTVHAYVVGCMCVCVYVRLCMCVRARVCAYVHLCVHMYVWYLYVHVLNPFLFMWTKFGSESKNCDIVPHLIVRHACNVWWLSAWLLSFINFTIVVTTTVIIELSNPPPCACVLQSTSP